jgi:hypothetical protein
MVAGVALLGWFAATFGAVLAFGALPGGLGGFAASPIGGALVLFLGGAGLGLLAAWALGALILWRGARKGQGA